MDFLKGAKSPSSESLLPVDAREKTATGTQSTDNRQRPASASKMAYARRTILVLFVCMLVLLGIASAGPRMPCHKGTTGQQTTAESSESSSFSARLKSASPSSLHDLLHRYFPGRFRDGVFESEHKAMEGVHSANPALATSILQLTKRDDTNSTATSASQPPPASETQTSDPPSETPSTTIIPPTSSSSIVEPSSTSSVPPSTTSSSRSSTPTPAPSSSLPETTLTTTTKPLSTTSSPPRTSKETTETYTSTSPNGAVVVVTRTNFVPADGAETPAPTSTGRPATLQNAAVRRHSGVSALAGVVGLAVLLLVV
ncbi:hypothetical protein C8A01DRAFT_30955 [Parachaetomium inaequale]|uniref:Uncharacterized protein n=1 Tax=Parachaetomium inaequale TaxID=2588326 RepID=A0AAN6PTV7_9PEZI|nr:hypothetical protein C8A01DRAFT_30955 [Parachaetomium inaequale]